MKSLFTILFFFVTTSLCSQGIWKLTPAKERQYKEIVSDFAIQEFGIFDEPVLWYVVDSFFKDMPLKIALKYYNDSSYAIRYHSFLKILGQNDTLAFKLLPRYISDTTIVTVQHDDTAGDYPFNQFIAREYEWFISGKYYWCDTQEISFRKYFRQKKFKFSSKTNYPKWPSILTAFIKLVKPYDIEYYHDLKDYHGPKYFYGR